jgi:prefoldin subunit 5
MSAEAEYTDSEVLTGAELYLYLLRQNEEQQERARGKLREYAALRDTLQVLTERSRRRVLAPVAGGLAYFPAELNATNTILVLLGDSWFAERSAVQATEIVGRRLDFLRREAAVLQQEESTLRSKQAFFLSEMPEAQDVVAQLLAEKDARRDALLQESTASQLSPARSTASSSSFPVCGDVKLAEQAPTPGAASSAVAGVGVVTQGLGVPQTPDERLGVPSPAADSASTAKPAELDYAAVDAALATFDEQDELTEDELIALEKELGDRLDDDAYVEQVMTERMIEKKEKRIRAELERRKAAMAESEAIVRVEDAAVSAPAPTSPVKATTSAPTPPSVPPKVETPPPDKAAAAGSVDASAALTPYSARTTYRTPADIFSNGGAIREAATSEACLHAAKEMEPSNGHLLNPSRPYPLELSAAFPAPSKTSVHDASSIVASPTTSTCSSSLRKGRHVHFYDGVVVESARTAAPLTQPVAPSSGEPPVSASPPSLLRSTYRMGEIVEHADPQPAVAVPPPPLLPTQSQRPKRKSLFMRDLEGDDA